MQWYDDWDLIQNILDGGKQVSINGETTGCELIIVEASESIRAPYIILSVLYMFTIFHWKRFYLKEFKCM